MDELAPVFFWIGVLVLVGNSCQSNGSSPVRYSQAPAPQTQRAAPAAWDERSDCRPGAPPNSLANALDPLKAHCDRARAVATIASLALMARGGGRIGLGSGLARGGASRAAAGAAGRGGAGAAADALATGEARLGGTLPPRRDYRISGNDGGPYRVEPMSGARGAYQVEVRGGEAYRVTPPDGLRSKPVAVRPGYRGSYEVEAPDGTRASVSGREVRGPYPTGESRAQTWEYDE